MNDSDIKNEPALESAGAPEPQSLEQQVAGLQRQVTILLLALFVVSGTLCVFLWRQTRVARKDLQAFKGPAMQMIQTFQQQEKPRLDAFVNKVAEYGKTHPDFAPIINKYKISVVPAPAGTAALGTAAPAGTAKAPAPSPAPATAPKK